MSRLASATTQVRSADTAHVLALFRPLAVALTPAEHARAARFASPLDRDDYLAAHLLVRACAAAATGSQATELSYTHVCPDCGATDHGRPRIPELPELSVSVSHTLGRVAAAAGPGRVAVDIEGTSLTPGRLAAAYRMLTPTERVAVEAAPDPRAAAALHWTYKECLVKWGDSALHGTGGIEAPPLARRGGPLRLADRWLWTWVDDANGTSGTSMTSERPDFAGGGTSTRRP
ncbi:4'-phosphopantetheinyl transferase family protein [Streptomyces sp. NBC_01264]|uniref:4'-phosphopantetheinyl transferase family protein n=1 Tax=Streptomyces sp. NBC_01264 TaxID=2903804 RepID=UPI002254B228|nr:4'-phosphopantetheinyl transferase superfamily protein [Streptomyces sp. NBC_01264]MCX4778476.1 4'-phosphopantetheinyl transferase superfamily protein [Streptomyces sp. NBC_01264]